jgi:hypothetical protein
MSPHTHPLGEGPPRLLRSLLVLLVTVGALVAGVWFTVRDNPDDGPKWTLHK